jgi:hypothetical protein
LRHSGRVSGYTETTPQRGEMSELASKRPERGKAAELLDKRIGLLPTIEIRCPNPRQPEPCKQQRCKRDTRLEDQDTAGSWK